MLDLPWDGESASQNSVEGGSYLEVHEVITP